MNKKFFDKLKGLWGGVKSNKYFQLLMIFLFIYFPFFISYRIEINKKFIDNSLLPSLALMFPLFIFPNFVGTYLVLIFIAFWMPYLINVYHYILFGSSITKDGLMAIFETTPKESLGFISHFFNFKVGVISLLLILIIVFFVKFISLKSLKNIKYFSHFQKILFIIFCFACGFGSFSLDTSKYQTMPYYMYSQYRDFKAELLTLRLKKSIKFDKFENIKTTFNDKKQTFVIVIGESSSRDHYSLYGYERNTNPLLSKRNDIFSFKNVVSPHAQTLLSLKKALSFANFENMDYLTSKGSIVNYFKDAGFKVFWVSNQERLGRFSTYTSIVASDSDVAFFDDDVKKHTSKKDINDYDMKDFYQKALDDKADKKVIFLHFIGSHSPYADNISNEFKKFSNGVSDRQMKVDAYDNTILFNDYVLNEYINMLKSKGGLSYLLYFSDHGEDVRDVKDSCFCHHEKIKSQPMLNIPFILWVSDRYKKLRGDYISKFNFDKEYCSENLIHSIISLSGLSNKDIEKSKSIFD